MRGLEITYAEPETDILAEIAAAITAKNEQRLVNDKPLIAEVNSPQDVEAMVLAACLEAERFTLAGQACIQALLDETGAGRRRFWENNLGFTTFLGAEMPGRIARLALARRYRRLVRVLEDRTLMIRLRSQDTDRATTSGINRGGPLSHRSIQLLPRFFTLGPKTQSGLILHEYCHNWMFDARHRDADGDTMRNEDGEIIRVYGRERCAALAERDPARARRNPDNLRYFSIDAAD